MEQGLGLEGPVQQVHRMTRSLHRALGRIEIGLGVDEERSAVGSLAAPAGGSGFKQQKNLLVRRR